MKKALNIKNAIKSILDKFHITSFVPTSRISETRDKNTTLTRDMVSSQKVTKKSKKQKVNLSDILYEIKILEKLEKL